MYIGVYIGYNGKEDGSYYSILGFILGIMEKKMEATVYWSYKGIMEKRMETTIVGYIGIIGGYIGAL